jgi:ribulose-phosphate 3-epimerase
MLEIIPAVNCHYKDFACVSIKTRIAESFARWVHIDVADGRYTFNKTWSDPARWAGMKTSLKLEVHLMAEEPLSLVHEWLKAGAARIIVHVETISEQSWKEIFEAAHASHSELMLSTNPETAVSALEPYLGDCKSFQVLCVHPGIAGQNFLPLTMQKVKTLRERFPDATIEVDGGMNLENARLAKDAGANIIVSATTIFNEGVPLLMYERLKEI